MITLFRSDRIYPCQEIRQAVVTQVRQLPLMISAIGDVRSILRFEFDCESIRPLTWLHNQETSQKIYWSDRSGGQESAGILSAQIVQGQGPVNYHSVFEALDESLSSDNERIRFYGGFCFDDQQPASEWDEFGSYRFVIPRFELNRCGNNYTFAVHISVADITAETIEEILRDVEALDFSRDTQYRNVPRKLSRVDYPSYGQWEQILADVKQDVNRKIVLARKTNFAFHVPIRPSALTNFLKQHTPGCFHFCFQPSQHHGFVGATPERLMRMDGSRLQTEAVAGTMPCGDDEDQRQVNRERLIDSEKCRREHNFVVDYLHHHLARLCAGFESDAQPDVLQLKSVQHLRTPMHGELRDGQTRADVLEALHPTPAVCGYPVEETIRELSQLETFSRGWYAGPVGYVSHNSCEFAVAIRSGLVKDHILSLYAGAGIVEGSTALEEWQEVENKISRFMKVFQ